jgi:hypothetical protein
LRTIVELIHDGFINTHLSILVFGPQVATISHDDRVRNLQNKRIQIRAELERLGHFVRYAEDLVDPNLPYPQNNAVLQEILIMGEFDLIINLVETPGSIVEASLVASRPRLANKTSLFIDNSFSSGLTASACEFAKLAGADFHYYQYPEDLTLCHLLGHVIQRVEKAQLVILTS